MTIDFVADPEQWIAGWKAILDESPTFDEAAAGWGVGFDGSILLYVEPDDELGDPPSFLVKPEDGEVESVRVVGEPGEVEAGFRLAAPYGVWKQLIQGELHPETAVQEGALSFGGDLGKAMEYRRAVKIMTAAASAIETEFSD